jgi:hypothetical protein
VNRYLLGWGMFGLAFLAMLHMISVDLADVSRWAEVSTPHFISLLLEHLSVAGTMFIAGQTVPTVGKSGP